MQTANRLQVCVRERIASGSVTQSVEQMGNKEKLQCGQKVLQKQGKLNGNCLVAAVTRSEKLLSIKEKCFFVINY